MSDFQFFSWVESSANSERPARSELAYDLTQLNSTVSWVELSRALWIGLFNMTFTVHVPMTPRALRPKVPHEGSKVENQTSLHHYSWTPRWNANASDRIYTVESQLARQTSSDRRHRRWYFHAYVAYFTRTLTVCVITFLCQFKDHGVRHCHGAWRPVSWQRPENSKRNVSMTTTPTSFVAYCGWRLLRLRSRSAFVVYDHLRGGVVYTFSDIYLSVCLSVCLNVCVMFVCQTMTLESLHVGSSAFRVSPANTGHVRI